MNFIKEVLKKLLIAIVTGAIILAFVYYKDHYLEQGNSDMEMLNSVNLEKKTQDEKILKKETDTVSTVGKEDNEEENSHENEIEPPLVIEVEKPYEELEDQNIQKKAEPIEKETPVLVEKKVIEKEKEKEIKKVEEDLENEIKKYRGTLPEVEPIEKETPVLIEKKAIIKEKKKEIKKVEEDLENEIKKYRETPQENTFNEIESLPKQNMISNKKPYQEDSFDEFKSSVKSRAQSAFDELDSEKF